MALSTRAGTETAARTPALGGHPAGATRPTLCRPREAERVCLAGAREPPRETPKQTPKARRGAAQMVARRGSRVSFAGSGWEYPKTVPTVHKWWPVGGIEFPLLAVGGGAPPKKIES